MNSRVSEMLKKQFTPEREARAYLKSIGYKESGQPNHFTNHNLEAFIYRYYTTAGGGSERRVGPHFLVTYIAKQGGKLVSIPSRGDK